MAASAIACPGCGDAVPYGRFSCPSCGELLASVGGARRMAWSDPPVEAPPEPELAHDPEPPVAGQAVVAAPADAPVSPAWPSEPISDALVWDPARAPDEETPLLEPEPEPYPARPSPSRWGASAAVAPSAPAQPGWPAPAAAADPSWPTPAQPADPAWPTPAPPAGPNPPRWGASPEPAPAAPAGPTWPAWPPRPVVDSPFEAGPPIPPTGAYPPGSPFAAAGAVPDPVARPVRPAGSAPTLPSLRLDDLRTSAFQERVIVVGGAIATVAFFLPWASAVIGTPVLPDPWDSFGIVGAWHLIPFLLTVGTVALSQFGARFPTWFRLALVPLATAGLLLGLDWYYLVTPIGGWIGGYVLAVGALVMAFGAVLALHSLAVASRNAGTPPSV